MLADRIWLQLFLCVRFEYVTQVSFTMCAHACTTYQPLGIEEWEVKQRENEEEMQRLRREEADAADDAERERLVRENLRESQPGLIKRGIS